MKRLISIFIFAFALYLSVSYWFFPNSPYPGFVFEKITYPVYAAFGALRRASLHGEELYAKLRFWVSDRAKLIDEAKEAKLLNEELREAKTSLAVLRRRLSDLERLVDFKSPQDFLRVSVPVYGVPIGSYESLLIAGAPKETPIGKNCPVLTEKGLIGRVIETSERILKIQLITDAASNVPVKILNSKENAIVAGNGTNLALLRHQRSREVFTDKREPDVKRGDTVVTSGIGGVYPSDIPVGVIANVDANHITVRPLASPNGLGAVIVLYEKIGL